MVLAVRRPTTINGQTAPHLCTGSLPISICQWVAPDIPGVPAKRSFTGLTEHELEKKRAAILGVKAATFLRLPIRKGRMRVDQREQKKLEERGGWVITISARKIESFQTKN
jgi:hypothetical protein